MARTRLILSAFVLALLSFGRPVFAQSGGQVAVKAIDTSTGATTDVGDNTNHAIRVSLVASSPTIAVSGTVAVSNLPTTLATNTGNADASTIRVVLATNQPAVAVTGTFWQATQPISGTVTSNIGTTNGLMLDATYTGRTPAGASPANGESNTNSALSREGVYNFIFNGSTWDRWTGAVTGTVTANLGTLNGIALDASVTGLQVSQASTTSGQKGALGLGAVTTSAPTYTTGQTSALSLNTSGELRVAISGGGSNAAASATGSAVPAAASFTGYNSAGNLVGVSTSNRFPVTCDNCGGGTGGTAATDNGTYTAGTSAGTPAMGALDDTSTTAATEDKLAIVRITAQRAEHVNLRNASGSEIGTSGAPVRTDPTGTTTQPVSISGNQAVNEAQINGVTPLMGNGVTGTGSQRVTIASDNTAFSVNASSTQSGTWTVQPGNTQNTTAWLVAGGKTHNNAPPGANNFGVLGFLANAAAPTYTETDLVLGSVDLHGSQRATLLDSGGTTMTDTTAHALKAMIVDSTGTVIAPTTQATQDTALGTITSVTGGMLFARGSATAPAAASADDDAVLVASDLSGRLRVAAEKLEDAAAASGDTGIYALTVRQDTPAGSTSADGDYQSFKSDSLGRLWVNCGTGCSGGTQFAEDAAAVSGDVGTAALAVRQDTIASSTSADGDYATLKVNNVGRLYTSSTIDAALPAGTNVIGHVIADSGSTTAVTGTVAVDSEFPAAAAAADGASNPTAPFVVSANALWNGTTWDRWKSAANALNSTGTGIAASQGVGQFDDVSPTAITENQFGNLRMSANRNLYGTIRDAAGNERGVNVTASNALVVDGSAVTQPVSGSVTVTQGTGTNLHIVCDSGCSTSSGFADNGAFTFGTTAINPIGGVLDDTSTNVATENSAAIARITPQKALHTNLRNQAGTEIGTSGAPIRTDPTGTTTQPVSGTITANIGTSGSLALDASVTGLEVAQGSTTSGQKGIVQLGAVTTSAPTYTTAQSSPLSLQTDGSLRAAITNTVTVASHAVTNAGTFATQSAITAASGSIASGAIASGAVASGAVVDGAIVTFGSKTDAKATQTDTTSVSAMAVWKQISASVQAPPSASLLPSSASGDAVTECVVLSTASTNSTNCKASAGNLYSYELYNTTTTVYYMRFYNASAAPTCSSATGFIRSIPIPPAAAAGGVGGAVSNSTFGVQYGTGIGYCITGGSAGTDNTSAAAGVFGSIKVK